MERNMTKSDKWINRTAAALLSTAVSVPAFAAAPFGPDLVLHGDASVKFNVSIQGVGEIVNEKLKTDELINFLRGRPLGADVPKNEKLGVVTSCEAEFDAAGFVVYDKDTLEVLNIVEDTLVLDIESAAIDFKDGIPDNADLFLVGLDEDVVDAPGFLSATGNLTYKEIGEDLSAGIWDDRAVCGEKFKAKSVTGAGIFADVVMKGKINAGKPVRIADLDEGIWPGLLLTTNKIAEEIDGNLIDDPLLDLITEPGQTIGYAVFVSNAGGLPLDNVIVNDPKTNEPLVCDDLGIGGDGLDNVIDLLPPGTTVECIGANTVSAEEIAIACEIGEGGELIGNGLIVNVATAIADDAAASASIEAVGVNCFPDAPPAGGLAITKTVDSVFCDQCQEIKPEPVVGGVGDIINYTITVENQTLDIQTGVTVNDTIATIVGCTDGEDVDIGVPPFAALGIGETAICVAAYEVTADAIAGACGTEGAGAIWNVAVTTSDDLGNFAADALTAVNCPGGGIINP